MSKYRWISVSYLLLVALLAATSARAQNDRPDYQIQFIVGGENHSAVSQPEFPDSEIRFHILKDGLSYNCAWIKHPDSCDEGLTFRLIEDGREVSLDSDDYIFTPVPLDVTIVYQLNQPAHAQNQAPNGSPRLVLEDIIKYLADDIQLNSFCLTMARDGDPPCVPVDNEDAINDALIRATDLDLNGKDANFTEVSRSRTWKDILNAGEGDEWRLVIWVLDDELHLDGRPFEELLPASESQLTELEAAKVALVVIDLMDDSALQSDPVWKRTLGSAAVPHLKVQGDPDNLTGGCDESWLICLEKQVNQRKSAIHQLNYRSTLMVDGNSHNLRLQLLSANVGLLASERADFAVAPYYAKDPVVLAPFVRGFGIAFNLLALFSLMLVLVLIERPEN